MSGPLGYVQFGDFELGVGTSALCVVVCRPKSDSKVDKKEADGKSGAVTTWKGAKPSEWDIELTWNRNPDPDTGEDANDIAIEEILYQLSPVGPNPGKPYDFAAARARVHGTSMAIVENVEGPDDKPGTSEVTAKIKATSWKAPAATANGQGQAQTPNAAAKWTAKVSGTPGPDGSPPSPGAPTAGYNPGAGSPNATP